MFAVFVLSSIFIFSLTALSSITANAALPELTFLVSFSVFYVMWVNKYLSDNQSFQWTLLGGAHHIVYYAYLERDRLTAARKRVRDGHVAMVLAL